MIACSRPNSTLIDQAGQEKQKLANKIRRKVASQLKQETQLRPCGTIGQMLNEIEVLGLSFYYYQLVDIAEGRKLLVKAVEAMREEVNNEPQIRPYLIRYPFAPRNVEIQIFLWSQDGRDPPAGALWGIEASGGILRYKIEHPDTKRLITVYQETYDEALQRLEDPSLPLASFEPAPEISQEELARLRKGISFVADDGSIWHLGADGCWIKDPRCKKSNDE